MSYKIENVVIKSGLLTEAQNMIPKRIQPILDEGAKNGWRLHTLTPTESAKGINIVIVWEVDK